MEIFNKNSGVNTNLKKASLQLKNHKIFNKLALILLMHYKYQIMQTLAKDSLRCQYLLIFTNFFFRIMSQLIDMY